MYKKLSLLILMIMFYNYTPVFGQLTESDIESSLLFADEQMRNTVEGLNNNTTLHPDQTDISTGEWEYRTRDWWTSGFFAGTAWYLHELNDNDSYWLDIATRWTADLEPIKYVTSSHDVGFQIFCSYGNAYRLTQNEDYKNVIITTANSLATRYDETIGAIRSWSWGTWNYPVIIDNMMNLELLLWASENGGDESLRTIAINHANKTLENHLRSDGTLYHIIDYNNDGSIKSKETWQGYDAESTWSRGQAWGIYGYTVMYRFTQDETFLNAAKTIGDYYIENLPDDLIPYSDFEDPNIPNVSKDASATTVACSALFELYEYTEDEKYKTYAVNMLNSLIENYSSEGTNYSTIIQRSCVKSGEPERGLIYSDYYFLEAVKRYKETLVLSEDKTSIINNSGLNLENKPNPFNSTTTISYSVSEDSFVEFSLYSAAGQKITSKINKKQSAGEYSFTIDAYSMNMQPGLYFYTIKAGRFLSTKKMILVK